jgi:hypothetical protein
LRWGKTRGKNEEKPAVFSVKKREKKALLAATEKAVSGPFGSFGKVANSPFGNEIDLKLKKGSVRTFILTKKRFFSITVS